MEVDIEEVMVVRLIKAVLSLSLSFIAIYGAWMMYLLLNIWSLDLSKSWDLGVFLFCWCVIIFGLLGLGWFWIEILTRGSTKRSHQHSVGRF